VVTAQAQRYQEQNRKVALQLLRAKLWVLADARTKEKEKQLKGEYKIAGWGNQIRSYVLQPYKQIKDLRTGVISHTPEEVLAGDLDNFIEAEIKMI
jgi:peptide chain release factor 2